MTVPATTPGARRCPGCAVAIENTAARFCSRCGAPLAAVAEPETLCEGRYEIVRKLGEGAKKRVYLARDRSLEREVAIARLKTDGLDAAGLERVTREARAMARLGDHPGIVAIFDIGDEDGVPHIVCEYMSGGTIEDRLEQSADHRLAVDQALALTDAVLAALDHAHSRAILHRDLKPANIWLTADGKPKIGDFGLALVAEHSRLTQEGMMVGTLAYLPPEQILGGEIDGRSDLYSVGAMIYEMVTGRPPFTGADASAVLAQHVQAAPIAPSLLNERISAAVETAILRLLAKRPEDRPASAAATRELFRQARERELTGYTGERIDIDAQASLALVGRDAECAAIASRLEEAVGGEGRLVLVEGESGAGKTRLVEEIARIAAGRSLAVRVGRCYEGGGAPAYWPWVQVIREHARERDVGALRLELGGGAGDVARIASIVSERLPEVEVRGEARQESEQARFRLFDAITTFLRNASRGGPLLVILEDLHWADESSLLLLRFLAGQLADSRLLVIGTFRAEEVPEGHALAEALAAFRRSPACQRIRLGGLPPADVRRLLEGLGGGGLPDAFVRAIATQSDGNPFLAAEIFRHLVAQEALVRVGDAWEGRTSAEDTILPDGLRDLVERRLARLSPDCVAVLELASVIGREFALDLLGGADDLGVERTAEILGEAVAARVVEARPGPRRSYAFTQGLIREALYRRIDEGSRARLHRRVANALRELAGDDLGSRLIELSLHLFRALPEVDVDVAIRYGRRAGEQALGQLGYEEAARCFERSLRALDGKARVEPRERIDLLLALADALRRAGEAQRAKALFREAAAMAKTAGLAEEQARAALGLGSVGFGASWWANLEVDEDLVGLLKEARQALGDRHPALLARVTARFAQELYWSEVRDLGPRIADQAVALSRTAGAADELAIALAVRCYAGISPDAAGEHAERARDAIAAAEATGRTDLRLAAHMLTLFDLSMLPDRAALDTAFAGFHRLAEELREAQHLWLGGVLRVTSQLLDGHIAEAERGAAETLDVGRQVDDPNALMIFGGQMSIVRFLQDRSRELEPALAGFAARYPAIPSWRAAIVLVRAEAGRLDEARALIDGLAARDFGEIRRDGMWLNGMTLVGQAAFLCGHVGAAARLREMLEPYADRYAMIAPGLGSRGPIAFALAGFALLLGDGAGATVMAERAVESARRMGDRPWQLLSEELRAAVAAVAGGDAAAARTSLEAARQAGRAIGLRPLSDRGWFRERIHAIAEGAGRSAAAEALFGGEGSGERRRSGTHRRPGAIGRLRLVGRRLETRIRHRMLRTFGRFLRGASDEDLERRFQRPAVQKFLFGMTAVSFQPDRAFGFEGDVVYELGYRTAAQHERPPDCWTITVRGGRARRRAGAAAAPAVRVRIGLATYMRILAGELDSLAAMMDGRLEVEGDLGVASRLVDMFGGISPVAVTAQGRQPEATTLRGDLRALLAEFDAAPAPEPTGFRQSIERVRETVVGRRPDLGAAIAPDGTVAVLFGDVEDFTRITDRLGDARAHAMLQDHHRMVRETLAAGGGVEVELQSDGLVLAFPTAAAGLRCAITLQRRFDAYNQAHDAEPLPLRLGLHVGEAIRDAEKLFGKTVILAARIASRAAAGEILVSDAVRDAVSPQEFAFRKPRELELKGFAGRHRARPVEWRPR